MQKKGLSLVSMVIYVVLFFAFSAFAVAMSMNMNYKTLAEKGNIWVNEQFQKLQYNLVMSGKNSITIDSISGNIIFSNNDEYSYDVTKKRILKNGGILVTDVEQFEITQINSLKDVPAGFTSNIDNNIDNVCVNVKFKKYGQEFSSQIFVTVGDGINV